MSFHNCWDLKSPLKTRISISQLCWYFITTSTFNRTYTWWPLLYYRWMIRLIVPLVGRCVFKESWYTHTSRFCPSNTRVSGTKVNRDDDLAIAYREISQISHWFYLIRYCDRKWSIVTDIRLTWEAERLVTRWNRSSDPSYLMPPFILLRDSW